MCPRIQTLGVEFALIRNPGVVLSVSIWTRYRKTSAEVLPLTSITLTEKHCSFLDHRLCPKSLCPIQDSWCRLVSCFTSWNCASKQLQEGTKHRVSLRHLWAQTRPDVTTSNHTLWLPWSIFSAFRTFHAHRLRLWEEKKKGNLLTNQEVDCDSMLQRKSIISCPSNPMYSKQTKEWQCLGLLLARLCGHS